MAITIETGICISFVQELFEGVHVFKASGGDTFKVALIRSASAGSGTYGPHTTNYSDVTGNSDEASGTGYSTGGAELTPQADPHKDETNHGVYIDWADPSWPNSTVTACGALIYNSSKSNKAVMVISFSGDQTTSNTEFLITLPAAAYNSAILRSWILGGGL
jgi:hypothetical protein